MNCNNAKIQSRRTPQNLLTANGFLARRSENERAELTGSSMSTRDELQQRQKSSREEYSCISSPIVYSDIYHPSILIGLTCVNYQTMDGLLPLFAF